MTRLITFVGEGGLEPPALTRQNTVLPAGSLRLVPIQSRSLPAVSFSGLDGVKSSQQPVRAYPARAPGIHRRGSASCERAAQ
jgi:hypothetical protein